MSKLAELLEVSSILVHGDLDHTAQDRKDLIVLVVSFDAILKFEVFVPEGMSKKVQSYTCSTTLEESTTKCQLSFWGEGMDVRWQGVQIREGQVCLN